MQPTETYPFLKKLLQVVGDWDNSHSVCLRRQLCFDLVLHFWLTSPALQFEVSTDSCLDVCTDVYVYLALLKWDHGFLCHPLLECHVNVIFFAACDYDLCGLGIGLDQLTDPQQQVWPGRALIQRVQNYSGVAGFGEHLGEGLTQFLGRRLSSAIYPRLAQTIQLFEGTFSSVCHLIDERAQCTIECLLSAVVEVKVEV